MGSRIVATGRALPRTAVTNSDLARVMASGESLVDIAAAASQTALERAGIRPAELDAIIVGTVSQHDLR
jgi:3-oxoacyl-[acyl-carrier-protein] synthase III